MIAGKLKPYYEAQAKDRQRDAGKEYGKGQEPKVVEKIPQPKSRDEAGRAAGVNHRYVDMATQVASVDAKLGEQVMAEGHDRR